MKTKSKFRPGLCLLALMAFFLGATTLSHERVAAPAVGASVTVESPVAVETAPRSLVVPASITDRDSSIAIAQTINATFYEWAQREPEEALVAATRVDAEVPRQLAIQSALSGWARADPATLAETALAFPEGEEKNAALTKAFRSWMIQDPQKAGDWIFAHPAQLAIAENVFRTENR